MQSFRQKLRELQRQHPLYQNVHPFWRDCFHGRLSASGLLAWGLDVYPLIRDFPRLYTHVASACESEKTMTFLAETIYEETGCGVETESHATLFRNFLGALNVAESEIPAMSPTHAGRNVLEFCWKIAREDTFLPGIALVGIGIERPLPQLFELLVRTFRRHYKMDERAVKFFDVHTVADAKHSQIAARIVAELAQSDAEQSRVCHVLIQLWDLQKLQMDEMYQLAQIKPATGGILSATSVSA